MWVSESQNLKSGLRSFTCRLIFLGLVAGLLCPVNCLATEFIQAADLAKDSWGVVQSKLRVRAFTEMMVPAFDGNTSAVPRPDGSRFIPGNLFNIAWADYEVGNHLRIFFWQRFIITLNSNSQFSGMHYLPRDPRFGVRWLQVFDVPELSTTYDVFIQPNITNNAASNLNVMEFGFRTNTSYAIPHSRWSLGLVQEFTASYFSGGTGPQAYAWVAPWFNYELSPTFSLQSSFFVPVQNLRDRPVLDLTWDSPGGPYMQSGIGINLSQQVSLSFLLNNYLNAPISLKNTWASMWLSLTIL